jgi:hypothetical protein
LFGRFRLQRYRFLETRSYATVHVWFFTIVDLRPDSHPDQMFQCVIFYIGFESGDPCSALVREVLNNTNSCLTNISCLSVSALLSLHLQISFYVINFLFCNFIGLHFFGKIPDFIYLIAVSLYIIFINSN